MRQLFSLQKGKCRACWLLQYCMHPKITRHDSAPNVPQDPRCTSAVVTVHPWVQSAGPKRPFGDRLATAGRTLGWLVLQLAIY